MESESETLFGPSRTGELRTPGNDSGPDQLSEALARARVRSELFGEIATVKLGRFTALRRLGAGGMGVVYAAYDDELDRKVAVKLLIDAAPEEETRLRSEARALAKLRHPNVVTVFEVGRHEGRLFLAMEYIDGRTLRAWATEAERDVAEVLEVFDAAGRGLAAAHAAGLVHRDFKPDNVMLGADGVVRVLDFGLARAHDSSATTLDERAAEDAEDNEKVEAPAPATMGVAGTPPYMAPEQWSGAGVTPATDQFAFAVALWEVLTGFRPFRAEALPRLASNILAGRFAVPAGRPLPKWIEPSLRRALSIDPAQRFPDLETMLARLRPDTTRRRRIGMLGGGIVATLVALGVGQAFLRADESGCDQLETSDPWGSATAEGVRKAFRATGRPHAEDTFERVDERVTTWSRAWHDERGHLCRERAEVSDSAYDLQMACLAERQGQLESLVSALALVDAPMVDRAVEATAALPGIEDCRDVVSLRREREELPPEARELAGKMQRTLADAWVALHLGHANQALEAAESLLTEPGGDALPGQQAEAVLLKAEALDGLGQTQEAIGVAREALARAIEVDAADVATRAAASLVWAHGNVMGELERAEDFERLGAALLSKARDKDEPQYMLDSYLGSAYQVAARNDEAIKRHEAALAHARSSFGDESIQVGKTLGNLGNVWLAKREFEKAETSYAAAHEMLVKLLGPLHVKSLQVEGNLFLLRSAERNFAEAWRAGMALVEKQRIVLGPRHPSIAINLGNLGDVARLDGRPAEGVLLLREAIDMLDSEGPDSYARANFQVALARALGLLGRREEALAELDEARKRLAGTLHEARLQDAACWVHVNVDDLEAAAAACAHGLELVSGEDPPPEIAASLQVDYTQVLMQLGRIDEARVSAERSAALLRLHPNPTLLEDHANNLATLRSQP